MKYKFKKDFLWGVAYSSHQVEGGNKNNDWWAWEKKGKTKDESGLACDSWNLFREDHQLAQELGCGGFRLSLEWSRIEPLEGEFSQEAIDHYRKVLRDLKKRGMKRVVTLWHWTLPLWLSSSFGWHRKESVFFFSRYCKKVIEELGGEIDIFLTLNEPMIPLGHGYLTGKFPPGKINPVYFLQARSNMIKAHQDCYDLIKKKYPNLPIGFVQIYNYFEPASDNWFYKFVANRYGAFYNHKIIDELKNKIDFVGIDYYFHDRIKFNFKPPFFKKNKNIKVNDLGWEIFPRGIYEVVKDAWNRYEKPIYIFENGLADATDVKRVDFIKQHLIWLSKAMNEGVELKGYFYWSLLDNFEWLEGFWPRFGLVEMDYQKMKRIPRSSYYEYKKIVKSGEVETEKKVSTFEK